MNRRHRRLRLRRSVFQSFPQEVDDTFAEVTGGERVRVRLPKSVNGYARFDDEQRAWLVGGGQIRKARIARSGSFSSDTWESALWSSKTRMFQLPWCIPNLKGRSRRLWPGFSLSFLNTHCPLGGRYENVHDHISDVSGCRSRCADDEPIPDPSHRNVADPSHRSRSRLPMFT